jgi:FixJ family two-component response regulator
VSHQQCIAIVDDDESVREATTNLFRSMGFSAVAFPSADQFLSSDACATASCLVLDVHMPGMDGLRLQRHLVAAGRHIPIVFITAYPDERIRARALASGAVCFLTKPFREEELLDGLRSALHTDATQGGTHDGGQDEHPRG